MNAGAYANCACQHCGNRIEFPLSTAGAAVACPHRHEATLLTAQPVEATAAFGGQVAPAPVSFFYKLGLTFVAVMMGTLPLVCLALTVAAFGSVAHHGTQPHRLAAGAPGAGRPSPACQTASTGQRSRGAGEHRGGGRVLRTEAVSPERKN